MTDREFLQKLADWAHDESIESAVRAAETLWQGNANALHYSGMSLAYKNVAEMIDVKLEMLSPANDQPEVEGAPV